MSSHITLYAEYRKKGEETWHLAAGRSITGDFKFIILGEPGDWTESDRFNSFEPMNTATLSPELREEYKNALEQPHQFIQFRTLDIGIYEYRVEQAIEKYLARFRTTLTALGMHPYNSGDSALSVSDTWRIEEDDSAKKVEAKQLQQMTLPISKELVYDITSETDNFMLALQNRGLITAIKGIVPDYDEDDTEIRLVAVN